MKIVFAGGGTGGHVNPAINIAKTIQKMRPGTEVSFIGTKRGIESTLVPKNGYEIDFVEVQGFQRQVSVQGIKKNMKAAQLSLTSAVEAKKIMRKRKPDVVVGTGGYVSWPAVCAASEYGIPCLIHEQNTFPGVTTKRLAKYADTICISFDGSQKYFRPWEQKKILLTGNPIIVDSISKEEARKQLGISMDEIYVLSFGGSMGARRVNELCFDLIEKYSIPNHICHDHAIGRVGYQEFSKLATEKKLDQQENITLAEYFYDMAYRQAAADIIICRAGAMTMAELAARGKAAIFIPSPHVAEDHQYKNAKLLADAGAAVVYRESELDSGILEACVKDLAENPNKRKRMEESIRNFAALDSATRIASEIIRLAEES